jgi:hypothetical protein
MGEADDLDVNALGTLLRTEEGLSDVPEVPTIPVKTFH